MSRKLTKNSEGTGTCRKGGKSSQWITKYVFNILRVVLATLYFASLVRDRSDHSSRAHENKAGVSTGVSVSQNITPSRVFVTDAVL
jgi:hypothetical protein